MPGSRSRSLILTLALAGLAGAMLSSWLHFFGGRLFPLNDGGMFAAYATRVAEGAIPLPECIHYNGDCLPFAYPPLAFLLSSLPIALGLDPIAVTTLYPPIITFLFLAVSLAALRRILPGDIAFLAAAAFLLLNHRSFEYLIMGGGITRATGALFFALSVYAALGKRAALAGLFAGLAALSHLEWGINAVALGTLLTLGRGKRRIRRLVISALVAAATVGPWALWAVTVLGPEPFDSAAATSHWSWWAGLERIVALDILSRSATVIVGIGLVVSIWQRQYLWPAVLILFLFLTPRHFETCAALSQAVLAGRGLAAVFAGCGMLVGWMAGSPAGRWARRGTAVLGLVLFAFWMQLHLIARSPAALWTLEQVPEDARAAMAWTRAEMPAGTEFLLVTGQPWYHDEISEWFPVISGHVSRSTVQGSEWLGVGVFGERALYAFHLNMSRGCERFHDAAERNPLPYTHVFATGRQACLAERPDRYREIHRVGEAVIYELVSTD